MNSIFDYLNENFEKSASSIMFYPSRKTFGEVKSLIELTQQKFIKSGLRPGDRCLMLTPLGDDFFINLIAALRLGAVPVLIDIKLGWSVVRKSLQGVNIKALITQKRVIFWPFIQKSQSGLNFKEKAKSQGEADLIYFTSGSTGQPKPVFYSLHQVQTQISILRRSRYELNEQAAHQFISSAPFIENPPTLRDTRPIDGRILYGYSSLAVFGLYQLLMGMGIWTTPLSHGKDLYEALSGVHRGVITDLCLNPSIIEDWILYLDKKYLPISDSIERLSIVSHPLSSFLIDRLNLRLPLHSLLEQSYGCTEAFPIAMTPIPRKIRPTEVSKGLRLPMLGYPNPEFSLHLRPTQTSYKIPHFSDRLAQQIWVSDLADNNINTGDLGFLNSSGQLFILGREKFTYQYKQQTYFSLLWELQARDFQGIKQAVLLQEDSKNPPTLVVSLNPFVKTDSRIQTLLELRRHLTEVMFDNQTFADEKEKRFELLVMEQLPVDPRHHSKVLRERVHLKRLRIHPINIILKNRINNKESIHGSTGYWWQRIFGI